MYQLEFKKSVAKEIKSISKPQLIRVVKRIQSLAIEPRPSGAIKLQGQTGLYRVRQGDYRIIYSINDDIVTILTIKVGHRKDIYDKTR